MGRPPKAGVAASQSLNVRVTPELMAKIDEARKGLSRPDWVRLVLAANVTRFEAGGDLSEVTVGQIEIDAADDPHQEARAHNHRRGEQRTKALGRVKATWFCAEDGCTVILGES